MNAKEFQELHGREVVNKVCDKLGVSYIYWTGVRCQNRTVGLKRAIELAQTSSDITNGQGMTVAALLRIGGITLRDLPTRIIGKGRDE